MSPKKFAPGAGAAKNEIQSYHKFLITISKSISVAVRKIDFLLPANAFVGAGAAAVVLAPAFNTLAKGLAPDNCKRSAELLGGSLCTTGAAAAGAGSGIPNKSKILGVAFDAAGAAAVPLSAEDENGLANGFEAFCCSLYLAIASSSSFISCCVSFSLFVPDAAAPLLK